MIVAALDVYRGCALTSGARRPESIVIANLFCQFFLTKIGKTHENHLKQGPILVSTETISKSE